MAKKNDCIKILKQQLKENNLSRLYLFFGEETFLKELYINRILKACPDMGFEDFNRIIIENLDADLSVLDDAIDSFPMMAEKKVVLVKDSGVFKKANESTKKYLTSRLKNIPDDTVLIFSEFEIDKRSALYKLVSKEGTVVEFDYLSTSDLVSWVIRECLTSNIKITKDNAEYLVSVCDPGINQLNNELQKLKNSGLDEICMSDIDKYVSKSLDIKVFELSDLITDHKSDKVISMLSDLKTAGESAFKLIYLLNSSFEKMLHAKLLIKEGEPYQAIAQKLALPPFIAKKYIKNSENFSLQKLKELVCLAPMTDLNIKQGNIDEWSALENYVYSALNP